eukprot:TRINITY_DN32017_c0_g1_i1.p1 TRINITY_DN32017_c0_g1~~TRINITY_DN32017_c0_g1_i1.p1  ORF type:complete len:247 (+),score=70.49 TRINITY_DN32017_c0_g1_i1:86-826(+)
MKAGRGKAFRDAGFDASSPYAGLGMNPWLGSLTPSPMSLAAASSAASPMSGMSPGGVYSFGMPPPLPPLLWPGGLGGGLLGDPMLEATLMETQKFQLLELQRTWAEAAHALSATPPGIGSRAKPSKSSQQQQRSPGTSSKSTPVAAAIEESDSDDEDYEDDSPLGLAEDDVELGDLPSIGSAGHGRRRCKPCAFVLTKGCQNGRECRFCHLCEPGEKKRRLKEKRQRLKGRAAVRVQAILGDGVSC